MSDPSTTGPPDHEVDAAPTGVLTTEVVATGHVAIDEALQRLEGLDDLDITLHPEEFDAIHGVLRESLANAGRDGAAPDSP